MTQMKQAQSIADAGAGSLCDATLHIGQKIKFRPQLSKYLAEIELLKFS